MGADHEHESEEVMEMVVNPVEVRRAIKELRRSAQPGKGRGMFATWQAADAQARAVYLTLFTEAEQSRVVALGCRLSAERGHADQIGTFQEAVRIHGESLIDMALPEEA